MTTEQNAVELTKPKSPTKYKPGSEPLQQFGTTTNVGKETPRMAGGVGSKSLKDEAEEQAKKAKDLNNRIAAFLTKF